MTFKRGQKIHVLLDAKYAIGPGSVGNIDVVRHPATFVRLQPGGEWVDVELETEHAGGVKRLSVPVSEIEAAEPEAREKKE